MSSSPSSNDSSPRRAVTMRDVAKAAKVHVTTVSLALRNSPQLPESTRQKIQALARRLGYRTNPLVAAFVQQRRISHPTKYQGLLGFVTHSTESVRSLPNNIYIAEMFRASEAHAWEVGFRLEPFEARDYGLNAARLERALHARGVRGLILPPTEARDGEIVQLNWNHFACVTLSTSIHRPLVDRVVTDHFGGARMAVRTAWERGYRRPGYFSLASTDQRTQGRWRGGYLAEAQSLGLEKKVPVLVAEDVSLREAFRRWYVRWKPDVLISIGLSFDTCLPVLEELGVAIPGDVGGIELNLHSRRGRFSGIDTNVAAISRIGVDMLVSKLYRNETGLSEHPQVSMHPPVWHEGSTLPARVAI